MSIISSLTTRYSKVKQYHPHSYNFLYTVRWLETTGNQTKWPIGNMNKLFQSKYFHLLLLARALLDLLFRKFLNFYRLGTYFIFYHFCSSKCSASCSLLGEETVRNMVFLARNETFFDVCVVCACRCRLDVPLQG